MTDTRHNNDFRSIVFALWYNWTISIGSIALPILLSLWIPMQWIPIISLLLMLGMISYVRSAWATRTTMCYSVTVIA
ncbi:MAG: hypothetical protein K2H98_02455, partial [Duncaniella sp.]|nr:hypothetical protein [Duncaniella sp.]